MIIIRKYEQTKNEHTTYDLSTGVIRLLDRFMISNIKTYHYFNSIVFNLVL